MRQVHHAGEKLFVDYAGTKPSIIDATTGEVIEVELFVAVLGASNYTYAEATRTQQVPDWIASHQRAFGFDEDFVRHMSEIIRKHAVPPRRSNPAPRARSQEERN
jgi:transposase